MKGKKEKKEKERGRGGRKDGGKSKEARTKLREIHCRTRSPPHHSCHQHGSAHGEGEAGASHRELTCSGAGRLPVQSLTYSKDIGHCSLSSTRATQKAFHSAVTWAHWRQRPPFGNSHCALTYYEF